MNPRRMNDLVKRLRGMANDPNVDFDAPTLNEAADRIEALEEALNDFWDTMNHGFMTVNCGPDTDPFISIKFVNLARAHAAHRTLIALALEARAARGKDAEK